MNIALGSKSEKIKFTKSLDAFYLVGKEYDTDVVDVRMERFDEIISMNKQTLIKIDVEGNESEVLKGINTSLANNHLKAIVILLNSSSLIYGIDEKLTYQTLIDFGFSPYSYDPYSRFLKKLEKN